MVLERLGHLELLTKLYNKPKHFKNWETLISPVRILFVGIEQVNDNARTLMRDVGLTKDRMMQALEIMSTWKKWKVKILNQLWL